MKQISVHYLWRLYCISISLSIYKGLLPWWLNDWELNKPEIWITYSVILISLWTSTLDSAQLCWKDIDHVTICLSKLFYSIGQIVSCKPYIHNHQTNWWSNIINPARLIHCSYSSVWLITASKSSEKASQEKLASLLLGKQ